MSTQRPVPAEPQRGAGRPRKRPGHTVTRRAAALLAGAALVALTVAACGSTGTHSGSGGLGAVVSGMGVRGLTGVAFKDAERNPDLDPGTALGRVPAPDFRLVNQFGEPMSLGGFRGKVVLLAFVDSECTTVCPLTTTEMVEAKQLLGAAGDQVQLLGVDANPQATSVSDVMAYSRAHGMVNRWDFLTGSTAQLKAVWRAYHIAVQIEKGLIDHTPALYLIDQQGRERRVYLTQMAYASVQQQAEILAEEIAPLLPGHPHVASTTSLAYQGGVTPHQTVRLPAAEPSSGPVTLATGTPHLVVFFATWLAETSDLAAELTRLNTYVATARRDHLPALTAVDEEVTEPSPTTVRDYLTRLGTPLAYPVALDTTGRLADGYGVQDQPWFTLTAASGKIVWSHDGWLPVPALVRAVQQHLAAQ